MTGNQTKSENGIMLAYTYNHHMDSKNNRDVDQIKSKGTEII